MNILKIILFFSSSAGYILFFKNKTKVSLYFIPLLVISSLSLFLFFGGILGCLRQSTYIASAIGILCLLFMAVPAVKRKTLFTKNYKPDLMGIILFTGTLIFTLPVLGFKLLHYDNFSHWAVIVKYLLLTDSFPLPDTKIVVFLDYPPGTAVFIYYVCRFLGNSQGIMLAAQNSIIFSCFYCIFGIVKEKRRFLLYSFLGMGCSVLSYLNLTIRINNLLVDFLLPVLALASISVTCKYADRILFISVYNFLLLGFTAVVKGTGIVFSLIAFIFYLYTIFKKNSAAKIKKIILTLFTAFGMSVPYILWRYRLYTLFSDYESKFSADIVNKSEQYMPASKELYNSIVSDFIKASFDLTDRAAQVFFICNLLVIVLIIFIRIKGKKRWNIGKVLLLADIMVVLYYIGILYMYLYSMPEEEAVNLAGFERYACSIITLFAGIIIIGIEINMERSFSVSLEEREAYKAYASPSSKRMYQYGVLFTLVLGINFIYSEINGLISIRESYRTTLPGKVEKTAGDLWPENRQENSKSYLVVASDKDSQVSSGEVRYVSRYFLYSPNVDVVTSLDAGDMESVCEKYDYVIVLDKEYDNINGEQNTGIDLEEGIYDTRNLKKDIIL